MRDEKKERIIEQEITKDKLEKREELDRSDYQNILDEAISDLNQHGQVLKEVGYYIAAEKGNANQVEKLKDRYNQYLQILNEIREDI